MTIGPGLDRLVAAMDATWPAARMEQVGPFRLRFSDGGGQRVTSATCVGTWQDGDIDRAIASMRRAGQAPIFQLLPRDGALDEALARRGFALRDPVWLHGAAVEAVLHRVAPSHPVMTGWPILALQRRLWGQGGIGPDRMRVMERVTGPRTSLLARIGQDPAGVAFVAADGDLAMIHAIWVPPAHRRQGVAASILRAAATWAQDMGCAFLALAVTKENFAANAMYAKSGMSVWGEYHYRRGQK